MKNLLLKYSLILSLLFLISRANAQSSNNAAGQSREVRDFTGISVDIPAEVSISQDNNYVVRIDASQELLDQIVTAKDGQDLVIKFKNNKWHWNGNEHIRITIHLPKLNSIELNGSGNVIAQTDFSTDKLRLEVNGSGDLKLMKISATDLDAEINGSGSILDISGTVNDMDLEVNGSGDIKAEKLGGKKVNASIAGSGDINIGETEALNAEIAGSGNVYYKGNPASLHKDVVGSGKVSRN